MTDHLREKLGRYCDYIRPGQERLVDVADVPDAADDNLGRHLPFPEDAMNVGNDGARVVADVLDAAEKEAHEVGAGAGGHDRLVERHAAGAVDPDAARLQLRDYLQLVPSDWHLDVDPFVAAEFGNELGRLLDHLFGVGREYLDAERNLEVVAVEQADDLLDMGLEIGALFLRQNRRVGGDAAGEAATQCIFDFAQVCRVNEYLHSDHPPKSFSQPGLT